MNICDSVEASLTKAEKWLMRIVVDPAWVG